MIAGRHGGLAIMSMRPRWFDRRFNFDLPLWMAPNVLERLRGTPVRLEERLAVIPAPRLIQRAGDAWSVQEHAGHLGDLEPHWWTRLDDLAAGRAELTPADLENRRTYDAHHNERQLSAILAEFRDARSRLVARLERAGDADWSRSALHPRLKTPMRLLDLAFFVAEHDDHHLARMSDILSAQGKGA
jgi:uncharacterized damage-inducible protein DinB